MDDKYSEKKTIKNKVVTNYIYNSLYQILTIIIPIITIPYVSRIFGANLSLRF